MNRTPGAQRYLRYLSIGLEIAISMAAPIGLGQWLDQRFGTSPFLVLAGCLLGILLFIRIGFRLSASERGSSGKDAGPRDALKDRHD